MSCLILYLIFGLTDPNSYNEKRTLLRKNKNLLKI